MHRRPFLTLLRGFLLSLFVLPALYVRVAPGARAGAAAEDELLYRWAGAEAEPTREREEEKA